MEAATNDALKLVSKSMEVLKAHQEDNDVDLDLEEVIGWLREAVDKLAESK